jgi:hypothetical protein
MAIGLQTLAIETRVPIDILQRAVHEALRMMKNLESMVR